MDEGQTCALCSADLRQRLAQAERERDEARKALHHEQVDNAIGNSRQWEAHLKELGQLRAQLATVTKERDESAVALNLERQRPERLAKGEAGFLIIALETERNNLRDQLSAQAAESARLREALKELSIGVFTHSREPLTNKDVRKLATAALSLPASGAERRYTEEQERVRGLVEALEACGVEYCKAKGRIDGWPEYISYDAATQLSDALAAFQRGREDG